MQNSYFADQTFEKISVIELGEYDHCIFKNCAFDPHTFFWHEEAKGDAQKPYAAHEISLEESEGEGGEDEIEEIA